MRVVGVEDGTTTVTIGNYFEWKGSTSTMVKYYYAGAERVAMRTGTANPLWLFGDHLGSTSTVANMDGSLATRQGYKAWGEQRFPAGASPLPTTFRYTGPASPAAWGCIITGHAGTTVILTAGASLIEKFRIIITRLIGTAIAMYETTPSECTDPTGHTPLLILLGLAVAVVVWLAYPETAYAPEADFVPPTDVDQSYGDKAYFDAAPGTGGISDIYTALTGETLFTGEEEGLGGRILAGATSLIPVGTASGISR